MATYTVTLNDGTKHIFTGLSYDEVELTYYDGSTYRNTLDAQFWGRAGAGPVAGLSAIGSSDIQGTFPGTASGLYNQNGSDAPVITQIADTGFQKSDEYMATPPHPLEKTMTWLTFYTEASQGGAVVAQFPRARVAGWSTGTVTTI